MRITCTTCGAPYEVDDAQIPPGGLTLKCSQCHASFGVQPAGGGAPLSSGEIEAGWDLDMPGAAPPPPGGALPPAGGANRYHIRRPSGKVFGPFLEQAIASMLEQGKLNGDEQLSLDGNHWLAMSQVPGLARFAASAPPPMHPPADDYADLPAPKGAIVPPAPGGFGGDMSDLPAPKGAIPPPPSPADPGGGGFGFGEFDLDADADLPAPKGAIFPDHGLTDLPAPKGAIVPPAPPAPAAPADPMEYGQLDLGGDEYADLPAPKGADLGGDEYADLPAPRGSVPPPPSPPFAPPAPPMGDPGGITDLPAPKGAGFGGITDLPAPRGADLGGGITDLPAPVDGVTGLPAPAGVSDLPAPVDGFTDLPQPKEELGYGNVEFGGDLDGGLDDLPMPAERSSGLELDADFDLPVPKEMVADSGSPESPDLVAPVESGFAPPREEVDLVTPKLDDDDDLATFEPPPMMMEEGMEDPEPAFETMEPPSAGLMVEEADEGIEPLERPSQLKKRLLMVAAGLVGVILVGGVAVGLVTDYGFFANKLLSGELNTEKLARGMVESGKQLLQKDTFEDYRQAAGEFDQAAKKLPDDPEPKALQGQALAAATARFGLNLPLRSQARDLAARVTVDKEDMTPQVKKLHGLLSLAFDKPAEAITTLTAVSDQEPGDAQAAVYLGWAHLAAKAPKKALSAFSRALAAQPGHAGALFGSAQAHHALGASTEALSFLDKALKASPNHPGALLLKAKTQLANNQRDAAQQTLRLATTAGLVKASRSQRGQAYTALGRLALTMGNNNEARRQFEEALKKNPSDTEALLGLGDINFSARIYSEALQRYLQARGMAPAEIEPAEKVARTYIAMQEFTKAQSVLVQIKKVAPEAPVILFLLGLVEAAANNLDAAETHFNAAIKKKPTYFMPYLHLSRIHLKRKNTAEALEVLKQAGAQLPGSPLVRNAEGEVMLRNKQFEAAQSKFEEALRLDKNLNQALFNLGVSLLRQDKLEQAQEKLLALRKKDRDFPGLSEQLGGLYVRLKDYAKAAEHYDNALKGELPSTRLRLDASFGYNLANQPDKSVVQTGEVLKQSPGHARARALRAEAFLLKKDKDEALIQIRQAAQRDKTVYIFLVKGKVHEARGEQADAVDAYDEVLKLDPKRTDVRFIKGRLLVATGTIKQGTKELLQAIKEQPGMAEAHLWLGIAYVEDNKEAKALAAYKTAVTRDPKLGHAYCEMGKVLFDRRRFGPALVALKKAVELSKEGDSWEADANYYLGEAAFSLKQRNLAIQAYLKFWRLSPGSALVKEVKKRLQALGYKPPAKEE